MLNALKQIILSTMAVVLGMLFFCHSHSARAEFRFRINEDLGSLDWGNGEVVPIVVQQLMEGLTISGDDGAPQPALASSWHKSKDGKIYYFKIRDNAMWSDGTKVCASQFVDAWTRVLSPRFGSPFAHLLFDIKGARAFHEQRKLDDTNLGIKANGCQILKVTLEHPAGYFPAITSHWVLFPVRLDLIKKFGRNWTEPKNLAVTGPYVLESWEKDKQYALKRNDRYFGALPRETTIKAVVVGDDSTALSLFRAGSLDWVKDISFLEKPKLSSTPEYREYSTFVGYHLGFDVKEVSSSERCAISLAIDKSQIPQVLRGGETPAYRVVPSGLAKADEKLNLEKGQNNFNPELAKNMWGARSKNLTIHYYAKDIHDQLMQWLQGQLKTNLGLDVKLVRQDGKTYWSNLQKKPPLVFLSGTTAAYAHPFSFLGEFDSGSHSNWGHYSSVEYDKFSRSVSGLDQRDKNYLSQISVANDLLVNKDCGIVPLYFRKTSALVKQGWKGFRINPMTYVYLKYISHN